MKRKNYSKELKSKVALAAIKGNQTVNEIASEFGIHTSLVNRWKKEAIEALPLVFGNSQAKQTKETEIERDRLYQKVGKLQVELDWLKKTRTSLMTIEEKKQRIQPTHPKLSVQRQCELIGLPRSSYYREGPAGQETPKNLEFMRLIDNEYTAHPFYGTRQIRNVLRRKGHKINRKRVQRLMRKMGIQSIAPKPNTSKAHPQNKVYPYLLRNFDVTRSNQVWCTDITYIPLSGGFVYLTAVMDWHSRYVLSWELSITMDKEFCISALERALRCHGTPYIFNTDQGSQYTSHEFTKVLKDKDIQISMDGKGRYLDNIFILSRNSGNAEIHSNYP